MSPFAQKFVSRKFLLHVAAFVVGTVALFLGILAGGEWVTLVIGLGGSYGVSNAAYHYAEQQRVEPQGWTPTDKNVG